MEREDVGELTTQFGQISPLAAMNNQMSAAEMLGEGPVRFLLVSGERDNGGWGLIGAFWLSIDGERGGFVGSPEAPWQGSEMVRSHRGAIARRWAQEEVYSYWQGQVGMSGSVMIDPQQHADTLFQVARRVGAV